LEARVKYHEPLTGERADMKEERIENRLCIECRNITLTNTAIGPMGVGGADSDADRDQRIERGGSVVKETEIAGRFGIILLNWINLNLSFDIHSI
jgi:hypothetical protein